MSPLHDLLGSLVSITFWAVLIDIGLWWRIILTLCLFVCLSLLVAGGWGGGTWYWNWLHICFVARTSKSFPRKNKYPKYGKVWQKKLHSLNKCWKCHDNYLSQPTHTHTHTHTNTYKHTHKRSSSRSIEVWTSVQRVSSFEHISLILVHIGYLKTTLITNLVLILGPFF